MNLALKCHPIANRQIKIDVGQDQFYSFKGILMDFNLLAFFKFDAAQVFKSNIRLQMVQL